MSKVTVLTNEQQNPYLTEVITNLNMTGIPSHPITIAGEGMPFFDARPLSAYENEGIVTLKTHLTDSQGVILFVRTLSGGCPGSILNALQLIGGAAYDQEMNAWPLMGRSIAILLIGPSSETALAADQLQELTEAMGGSVVVISNSSHEGGLLSPEVFVQRFARGPLMEQVMASVAVATRPAIDLSLGDVQLPPPEEVVHAVQAAARDTSVYTPPAGLPSLRRKLFEWLSGQGMPIRRIANLVVTSGASMGIYACLVAHLRPGDGVLIPDPGYPNFRDLVEALHLRPLYYSLEAKNDFLPDPDELSRLAQLGKAIIWNFPHNPLGSVPPREVVEHVVALAQEHDLLIISDEVYADLVWEGEHVSPLHLGAEEHTCVVGSFSKAYAMAGYRLGWVVAPERLSGQMARSHWSAAMSPSLLSQKAGLAVLEGATAIRNELRKQLGIARESAMAMFEKYHIPSHKPQAGVYLWLDIARTGLEAREFTRQLSQEERVYISPGSAFGRHGSGRVRVSFAMPKKQIDDGLERLGNFYIRNLHKKTWDPNIASGGGGGIE